MGLSFGKLLLLAAIIFAVWYLVKRPSLIEAMTRAARREMVARRSRPAASPRPGPGPAPSPALVAEDLVQCARCGTYVAAAGDAACARPDCPHRR